MEECSEIADDNETDYIALADDLINQYAISNLDKIIMAKDTYRYILLAIFYCVSKYKTFDHIKFISYLIVNKDIINSDEHSMRLLTKYYSMTDDSIKDKVLQIFDAKYKKIVLTNMKLNAFDNTINDIEFNSLVENFDIKQIEQIIKYYLYEKANNNDISSILINKNRY